MDMCKSPFLALVALSLTVPGSSALAESWCAVPLYVHEWGVQVFASDGSPAEAPPVPAWFHRAPPPPGTHALGSRVRDLPADTGVRALPILHFYSPSFFGEPIPLALEVAFRDGDPSAWYPQVDRLDLGSPSAELVWERLSLSSTPAHDPQAVTDPSWPDAMRRLDALWVNTDAQSERFVFYEADTAERSLLSLERGDTWSEERGHYVLRNEARYDVHDVFFVHREGEARHVFFAPRLPAGTSAGFLLEEHAHDEDEFQRLTVAALKERLVDGARTRAPTDVYRYLEDCVMMRDPAVAETAIAGHRLFTGELEALLAVWEGRFFGAEGTTILYRESDEYLQAQMPLGIYTDMFHYPVISRLGLALWEGVSLP
jgi:hypothetical protein